MNYGYVENVKLTVYDMNKYGLSNSRQIILNSFLFSVSFFFCFL